MRWRCKPSRASFPLGVPRAAVRGGLQAALGIWAAVSKVPTTISPLVSGPRRDGKGHAASRISSPTPEFFPRSRHSPCRRSAGPAPRCGDGLSPFPFVPGRKKGRRKLRDEASPGEETDDGRARRARLLPSRACHAKARAVRPEPRLPRGASRPPGTAARILTGKADRDSLQRQHISPSLWTCSFYYEALLSIKYSTDENCKGREVAA